jgi:hypothetical protein
VKRKNNKSSHWGSSDGPYGASSKPRVYVEKQQALWVVAILWLISFYLILGWRAPILSPLVLWFTGLFVKIALIGLKHPTRR